MTQGDELVAPASKCTAKSILLSFIVLVAGSEHQQLAGVKLVGPVLGPDVDVTFERVHETTPCARCDDGRVRCPKRYSALVVEPCSYCVCWRCPRLAGFELTTAFRPPPRPDRRIGAARRIDLGDAAAGAATQESRLKACDGDHPWGWTFHRCIGFRLKIVFHFAG